jgi:5-formyltetrahydrofolate cyclo-ligase
VLPGLAFSPLGARCGRGGGYYDTFLARYKATLGHLPYLVAVAFNEQVVDDVPTTDMDIPADKVLWEKGE